MNIQVKHDDDHTLKVLDDAAMCFLMLSTHGLNTTLLEQGIADIEKRKEICNHFIFALAYFLDAGWFEHDSPRFFPTICFRERGEPTEEDDQGAVKVAHIPTDEIHWHESAGAIVWDYFDRNEVLDASLRRGSYDMEDS